MRTGLYKDLLFIKSNGCVIMNYLQKTNTFKKLMFCLNVSRNRIN